MMPLPEGFSAEIRAEAGYDYRDDPDDGRGASGLVLRFILRGPAGALTWEVLTGWMHRPIDEPGWSIFTRRAPKRSDRPGVDDTGGAHPHHPTAGPVASHVPDKREDYWPGPFDCDVIGGQCYGDVGYTIGDRMFEALTLGGQEAAFDCLREIYQSWLGGESNAE